MEDRLIKPQDDANAVKKICPPPAKIEWSDNDRMPSHEEMDRLGAFAEEETDDDEEKDDDGVNKDAEKDEAEAEDSDEAADEDKEKP